MMLRQRQLPTFTGVPASLTAGQLVTVSSKLTLGDRAHVLWLQLSGTNASTTGGAIGTLAAPNLIQEIRLLVNGKVQRRMTGQQLNYLNGLNGSAYAAKTAGTGNSLVTLLPIFLAEPWRQGYYVNADNGQLEAEETMTAWNLAGIDSCTIEVDLVGIVAGANVAFSAVGISGFYEFDPAPGRIGDIVKWKIKNVGAVVSPMDIDTLDKLTGAYQGITIFPTSGGAYVSSLLVVRNGEQIRQDITRNQNDATLLARLMTPTALDTTSVTTNTNTGQYNFIPDYDDPIRNALVVATNVNGRLVPVNELVLRATWSLAGGGAQTGNVIVLAQVVGPVE